MPKIESYRKQAKLLQRWHKEGNYSLGGHVRYLERYREISDAAVLAMPFPLALAQEIVAVEAGYRDWPTLKAAVDGVAMPERAEQPLMFTAIVPILFVRDVAKAVAFYVDMLGFQRDFLHGKPPFYAAVSRGGVCLHLRFVHETGFAAMSEREGNLILASVEVTDVKALFADYEARDVPFAQRLVKQAWGGLDFHVRDPDGNQISFVEYRP